MNSEGSTNSAPATMPPRSMLGQDPPDHTRLRGLVSEIDLLNHMLQADHVHQPDETIADMVDTDVPVVGPNARLETLMSLISHRPAVVIVRDDRVEGILTKIDILDYLSSQIR